MYDSGSYDDVFGDCDSFAVEMDSLRSSLMQSVKTEVTDKITALEKENKELTEKQKNLLELEYAARKAKADYERKAQEMKERFEKDAVSLLIDSLPDPVQYPWRITSTREQNKKCDKCDNDRKLHAIDSKGHDHLVQCDCDRWFDVYRVSNSDGDISIFPLDVVSSNGRLVVARTMRNSRYRGYEEVKLYQASVGPDMSAKIDNNLFFKSFGDEAKAALSDDDDGYNSFFSSKEECQKAVDWLNKKEKSHR